MNFERSRFGAWIESAEAAAAHHLKQSVLSLDEEGHVIVNFSPALAQLIREARERTRTLAKAERALNSSEHFSGPRGSAEQRRASERPCLW